MNPTDWINEHYGIEFFSGDFTKLKNYVEETKLNKTNSKVITIAGTNGKGQTSRVLAQILSKQNITYSLWTSPHLKTVNERFVFNQQKVSDSELMHEFEELHAKISHLKFSYFEFLYICFLELTHKHKPSIIIQEVGLGGRLDATNALDADLAVITSISRDHQELLGNSYRSILFEKIAVARKNKPLLTCFGLDYLKKWTQIYARKNDLLWSDLVETKVIKKNESFSKMNIELAKKAYEIIFNDPYGQEIKNDFEAKRGHYVYCGAHFDLYPSHNPDGVRKLVQYLNDEQYNNYDLILFAPSKRSYKDLQIMCKILMGIYPKTKLRLVSFDHYKALAKMDFIKLENEFELQAINNISNFKKNNQAKHILVIGSNYFLSNFLK